MKTKHIRSVLADDFLSGHTVPLPDAEILSALNGMTPLEQAELIEWLAAESPEDRNKAKVPAVLKRMTQVKQRKLVEWMNVAITAGEDKPVRLRREGEVKELNVQEWLKSSD